MLGAELPLVALDYGPCLGEILRHGENALLFDGAPALAAALTELLGDFPNTLRCSTASGYVSRGHEA